MVTVSKLKDGTFNVTVASGGSETQHTVSLSDAYYEKLTGGKESRVDLIRRSFEFLLKRESKESILRQFDLPVISRYFPEYERTIGRDNPGSG